MGTLVIFHTHHAFSYYVSVYALLLSWNISLPNPNMSVLQNVTEIPLKVTTETFSQT